MKHLANSPRGKFAKTQEDLLNIATNKVKFTEEDMTHPLAEVGFCQQEHGDLIRMDPDIFESCVYNLLRSRPSALLWDITPVLPYDEHQIYVESPEFFNTTVKNRATELAEHFMRNPKMAGFKLQMHNVALAPTDPWNPNASISMSIYTVDGDQDPCCPVNIKVKYRTKF